MKSSRMSVLALTAFAVACGASSNPDVAAKAGDQQLSSQRLAEVLAESQAPLEKDVARNIAELWVNYELAGIAAANNDSLSDPKVMREALWSQIDNIRVKKFYDAVSQGWDTISPGSNEDRYANGEAFAARHILIQVAPGATPEQVAAARKKAEGIIAEATPQNFASLASKSDEPGAAERGGDLGMFGPGMMVPEFEQCVKDLKVGEISKQPCQTSFGFHIIYRSPFNDVKDQFVPFAQQRNAAIAESTYLVKMEDAAQVKVEASASVKAKAVAKNPLGYVKDNAVLASYKGGKLTAARFGQWLQAYPPQTQIRPQLVAAPDSMVDKFIQQIVRNELVLHLADSAKFTADSSELQVLFLNFRSEVPRVWSGLGVDPATLVDSTNAKASKSSVAAARIDQYFSKLVKNEAPFVEVAYPVAFALQQKYSFSINEAGLDKVMELAKNLRASSDSAGAAPAPAPAAPEVTPPADSGRN